MDTSFSGKPLKTAAQTQIAFNLQKCEFEDHYGQHVALWFFGDQSSEIKKINLYHIFSYGNPYGEYDPRNIMKLGRELSHATVTAYSEAKRPPIPIQTGHLFRSKSAGHSEANRPSYD